MNDEHLIPLLERYAASRDPALRDELFEHYLPLARAVARKFSGRGVETEDLEQVAGMALLKALEAEACAQEGFEVRWYSGAESGVLHLDPAKSQLAVGVLQGFLDGYLKEHEGEIDYIHDDDALIALAKQENAIGFLLPAMEKSQLFRGVIADGILPRKTFSMGHSREKRYYLEGRKIK